MTELRSDFLKTMTDRGFIHQCTDMDALDGKLRAAPIVAYNGIDCTGPSLHVGHMVPVMMMRHFQKSGHKPIVLLGGGTTRVGDPSGKDDVRKMLSDDEIQSNIDSLRQIISRFLKFGDGPTDAVLVNNADWLDQLEYIPFLRDIGRHFTINRMLTFDSVKLRLDREQPLTFLEFNYMILQSYDFVELHRQHDCLLQIGGSDQWGNIVGGVELGRRMLGAQLFGLTCPLITTSSGAKMGKTAAGAVWLKPEMLSPYDYWQYWRNTEDADVGRFLRLFTDLPLPEIAELEALEGQEINDAKKKLADEATMLAHGPEAARQASETARRAFEEGVTDARLPTIDVPKADIAEGVSATKLFHMSGLTSSAGEARRQIKGGGAKVNDNRLNDELAKLYPSDANADGVIKLSLGKKKHMLVRIV